MPDLSQLFVASLARALNRAQVPCILWGHCLLGLHGVPSIIGASNTPPTKAKRIQQLTVCKSIDFVIPDNCSEAGARALSQCEGLVSCRDPVSCPDTSSNRHSQPPVFHAHLDDDPEITAGLYFQSDTLWFLPPLDRSLLSPSNELNLPPYFALASDRSVFPPWRPG